MKTICCLAMWALAAVVGVGQENELPPSLAESAVQKLLGFDYDSAEEWARAWHRSPAETIRFENSATHSGRGAVVIERDARAGAEFSNIATRLPVEYRGERVELRGFLKTEDVVGRAGLWLRADNDGGMLALDNMAQSPLAGTTEWREFSVRVPLTSEARWLVFGALLEGRGKLWVDDLRLFIDDRPVWLAEPKAREQTVLERDHEFDAASGVSFERLSPQQVENLTALGEIWGFLKYHHSRVMAGDFHWDYELFRQFPAILAAPDRAAANGALAAWIDRLGPLSVAQPRVAPPGAVRPVHLPAPTGWLNDDARWGPELGAKLRAVLACTPADAKSFYVSHIAGVGNPRFDHEPNYANLSKPDAGYRLLALFRFWNIIRYWFPYRDLIDEDWTAVLAEFVPRVGMAQEPDDYAREMMALIARVHDTHANLWSSLRVQPPVGEASIDAELRFIEDRLVAVRLGTEGAGLQRGDVIETIDGRPVDDLVREWTPYYAASNEPTRRRDIANNALRGPVGPVLLQLRREGAAVSLAPNRAARKKVPFAFHDLPGPAFRLLGPEVAYLKLSNAKAADVPRYLEEARDTRGLVVDIRNYPGEFMVFALGERLVEKKTSFAQFTAAAADEPGKFSFRDGQQLQPKSPRYPGRVVVLVDEVSQSNAEYTAMALRAAGALIVGSTTAGADGNVSMIPLPGGLRSLISGIGVFYPDGRPTQRVGIVPDLAVRPTIAGIRAGRDEVLEAAWREILGADADFEPLRAIVRDATQEVAR